MLGLKALLFACSASAITTSLWIPFKTIAGTPVVTIAEERPQASETVYVVACPTASPSCAIAPSITLTEGPKTAAYYSTATGGGTDGVAFVGCALRSTDAVCSEIATGGGNVQRADAKTLAPEEISFQAVEIVGRRAGSNVSSIPSPAVDGVAAASTSGAVPLHASAGLASLCLLSAMLVTLVSQ